MVPRDQGGLKPKYIRFTIIKDKRKPENSHIRKAGNSELWLMVADLPASTGTFRERALRWPLGRFLEHIIIRRKRKEDLLESEEESAGPHDEEQGQVEDSLLPGHHHPSVAAESVFSRQLLPLSHLPCYHHRRHGVLRSAQPSARLRFLMSVVLL